MREPAGEGGGQAVAVASLDLTWGWFDLGLGRTALEGAAALGAHEALGVVLVARWQGDELALQWIAAPLAARAKLLVVALLMVRRALVLHERAVGVT